MSRIQLALNVSNVDEAVEFTAASPAPSPPSGGRAMPTSPSPIRADDREWAIYTVLADAPQLAPQTAASGASA